MSRDEVARRLQAAAPDGARATDGADELLPAIRFASRREPDAGIDLGRCKIGGAPDVGHGTAWPHITAPDGERRPLQFIAQIDLAEAADAAPGPLGFPAPGLLSFFADLGAEGLASASPCSPMIMFTPADLPVARCSLRLPPLPTAHLAPVGMWSWPGAGNPAYASFAAEYDADLNRLAAEHFEVGQARHLLGGHGDLLIQIDSDSSIELGWGDDGRGRMVWRISRADLAAANWTAARVTVEGA